MCVLFFHKINLYINLSIVKLFKKIILHFYIFLIFLYIKTLLNFNNIFKKNYQLISLIIYNKIIIILYIKLLHYN